MIIFDKHPFFQPLRCVCVDSDALTCARVKSAAPDDGGLADDDVWCECPCHWEDEEDADAV